MPVFVDPAQLTKGGGRADGSRLLVLFHSSRPSFASVASLVTVQTFKPNSHHQGRSAGQEVSAPSGLLPSVPQPGGRLGSAYVETVYFVREPTPDTPS